MSNILGNALKLTAFGESHGSYIGGTLDGLCAGVKIDESYIKDCLSKRRPQSSFETKRVELDEYEIISGVFNGYTTGTPITVIIKNSNTHSSDYDKTRDLARPSHADYVADVKYHGYQDYRGGGHFSGRITAVIVFFGAIMLKCLEDKNILIGSHISSIGKYKGTKFSNFEEEIKLVNSKTFPTIDDETPYIDEIKKAQEKLDSVGGIIETAVINLPVGLGEPMFDSLEGSLSKAMFGIGGIKGIEFGLGFGFSESYSSNVNDEFRVDNGKVYTTTNNNGGINGGISNGMPVVFNVAVRPTPSISVKQHTINFKNLTNEELEIVGRHDPAIIRRANIVVRCMTALVIADLLCVKDGTDTFYKIGE